MLLVANGLASARRTAWWWLTLAAVLLGAGLRLWQWAAGTTFFMDELAVIHNLATRSAWQLVSAPLAEQQVAPPLFLLAEKACLTWLGPSEWSLRLPALLAALAALPLLWAVAWRVLDQRLVPLVLLGFGLGFTFIYYGSQVKPYASDLAGGLLVLWLALRLRHLRRPRPGVWGLAALVGLGLPFYSQAAVLVLAGCGAALVLLAWLDPGRPRLPATLAVAATWALGCGAALLLARHLLRPLDQEFMHYYWREGFLPLSARLPQAFGNDLGERLALGLLWPHPALLWVLGAALGLGLLWRQRREAAVLLLAPWVVSTLAALLGQFPLRGRLMDFLLPSLLLFLFAGWQGVVRWGWRRGPRLGGALLALGAAPVLYGLSQGLLPPYCAEGARPLLAALQAARRPADGVYAYYAAGQYLRWYGPRYGLPAGRYLLGQCHQHVPGAARSLLHEVDAFRGRRVWVVFIHADSDEERALSTYLDSIGRAGPRFRVARQLPAGVPGFPYSAAQLYDLTDARRAARYAAATFPLPPAHPWQPADIVWGCYGPQYIDNR